MKSYLHKLILMIILLLSYSPSHSSTLKINEDIFHAVKAFIYVVHKDPIFECEKASYDSNIVNDQIELQNLLLDYLINASCIGYRPNVFVSNQEEFQASELPNILSQKHRIGLALKYLLLLKPYKAQEIEQLLYQRKLNKMSREQKIEQQNALKICEAEIKEWYEGDDWWNSLSKKDQKNVISENCGVYRIKIDEVAITFYVGGIDGAIAAFDKEEECGISTPGTESFHQRKALDELLEQIHPRNQGDIGICFAQTASLIVDLKRLVPKHRNQSVKMEEEPLISPLYTAALYKYKQNPFQNNDQLNRGSVKKALENLISYRGCPLATGEYHGTPESISTALRDINRYRTASDVYSYIYNQTCARPTTEMNSNGYIDFFNNGELKVDVLLNKFNKTVDIDYKQFKSLLKEKISSDTFSGLGLSYCANAFSQNPTRMPLSTHHSKTYYTGNWECGDHAVILYDVRYNKTFKQCEYKTRNSWGMYIQMAGTRDFMGDLGGARFGYGGLGLIKNQWLPSYLLFLNYEDVVSLK